MAKKTIKVGLRSTGAEPAAGDVNISYKGSRIAGLSDSSTAVLETENTIVTGDIEVEYTKSAGGTDYFQYCRNLTGFFEIPYTTTYTFPFDTIEITAPNVRGGNNASLSRFFSAGAFSAASQKNRGVKKIVLNIGHIGLATGNGAFNGVTDLEEIEINADNSSNLDGEDIKNAFSYLPALKKITGIVFNGNSVRWTYGTSSDVIYFPTGSALEEIRFVQNSMSYNASYKFGSHGHLSDDSLVSIANAMDPENQTKTIVLHSTAAGKLSTIAGTVADGLFTISAGGSTTLLDFITQTKGWTIA